MTVIMILLNDHHQSIVQALVIALSSS